MIVLGFDTATRSTAVALRVKDGLTFQARDDPGQAEHPGHATRLLGMADELLARASLEWGAIERIAVGLGPGTFTGLRVGVATARGLAQSLGVQLSGVSSLRALAEPALHSEWDGSPERDGSRVLAVLDARRGEAFAAAYELTTEGAVAQLAPPRALAPEDLGGILEQVASGGNKAQGVGWRAVGDGAVRFRGQLEDAGVTVAPDPSPLHLLSGEAICALGALGEAVVALEAILPDYCRRPDAEIALERKQALTVAAGARDAGPEGGPRP